MDNGFKHILFATSFGIVLRKNQMQKKSIPIKSKMILFLGFLPNIYIYKLNDIKNYKDLNYKIEKSLLETALE